MKQITTIIFALICAASFGQRDLGQKYISFPDTVVVTTPCCNYESYVVNISSDIDGNLTVIELCNTTGHVIEWFYDSVGNWYATGFDCPREKTALFISPDINTMERVTCVYASNTLAISLAHLTLFYDPIPANSLDIHTIELRFY